MIERVFCFQMNSATASSKKRLSGEIVPSIKQRIAGLDELRGVAILLVLICHALQVLWGNNHWNAFAYAGVNIFFMISGYLICTILQNTRRESGFFRTFYIRRIFRIWPLFFVITGLGVFVSLGMHKPVLNVLPYYLTFTMNFLYEQPGIPSAMEGSHLIALTDPMWSLAIEEQFYLILPILVRLTPSKRLPFVVAAICTITALGSLLVLHQTSGEHAPFAYPNFKNTALRIHYIGFGVLLALQPRLAYAALSIWLGASVLFLHFSGVMEITIAFVMVWLVARTIQKVPVIRNLVLARFGFLCYGIYLIHWPLVRFLEKFLLPRVGKSIIVVIVVSAVFITMSFVSAHLSYKYFENPIQKLRTRFERPRL